jgi:RNA polymerase sigma factor (sigma-70 family)
VDEAAGRIGRLTEDRRLIEGYLAGRQASHRTIERWILRVIDRRYTSLRQEREDLRQQVHEKLVRGLQAGGFRHGSSLKTFVTSVVHHTCIDALRRRYLVRWEAAGDDLPAEWGDPYHHLERLERRHILHRLLHLSPEICRTLWRLIFLERLDYRAVGRRLAIPEGTVKSRVFGCRQKALAIYRKIVGAQGVV